MLRQFFEWRDSGEKSASDLLDICLSRIAEYEPEVRAWVEVAPQPPLGEGPLSGIPFGVKDVFETRGMATEYGSPLYVGRKGSTDAAIVTDLRRVGAVLLGKTETAAFASFDPAPTRNPALAGHTPGGSSSGSAAAVAARMVPFALGTQTLGSVLRPASYCGICGFKPTFGLIPMDGVLPFAPSLDTAGFFTETVDDMVALWNRGFGAESGFEIRRAAWFSLPAEEPMADAVAHAVDRVRAAGIAIDRLELPVGWDRLVGAARLINDYEGARTHERRYREFGERIGARLAELIRRGLATPEAEYHDAQATIERMKSELHAILWDYSVILSPAATGPAPAGFQSTGDPANNACWTALGVPALTIPLPAAVPCGLQIAAAWGRDDALVTVSQQLALAAELH